MEHENVHGELIGTDDKRSGVYPDPRRRPFVCGRGAIILLGAVLIALVGIAGISTAQFQMQAGMTSGLEGNLWYDQDFTFANAPYVFATTQSVEDADDPSAAHVKDVTSSGFLTQHCKWDAPDSCDFNHAALVGETNGWLAIDDRMGTLYRTEEGAREPHQLFLHSSGVKPLVFTQVQTEEGSNEPLNTQVLDVTTNEFTVEFCEQEGQDSCDTHTSEDVAVWALDPTTFEKRDGFDYGTVTSTNSGWSSVSFTQSFSAAPVVIAMVQTEKGGEEALYPEVKDVTTSGADIRYCESNGGDGCDGHVTETLAWVAAEPGVFLSSEVPFRDGFDVYPGEINARWSTSGATENGDCGAQSGSIALSFDGSGTRYVNTDSIDVSTGGKVRFYLGMGTGGCNNPETNEDVELQYSTDGTWPGTVIASYDVSNFGTWTRVVETIPAGAETASTQFRWVQTDHSGAGFDNWAIDDVKITLAGPNDPPNACFVYSTSGLTVNVDASCSDDPDGDPLSYFWDYGDGGSGTGVADSHTYPCNDGSGGSFDITLSVTDGNGGSDSALDTVTVSDDDSDGDGLEDCVEEAGPDWDGDGQNDDSTDPNNPDTDGDSLGDGAEVFAHGTNPNDKDTDNDEFWDGDEVNSFNARSIFCDENSLRCEEPHPFVPDAYLEVDGWIDCNSSGNDCDLHYMSDFTRSALEGTFASHGIRLHIDNGIGAGDLGGGGQLIGGADSSEQFEDGQANANESWSLASLWHVSDDCTTAQSGSYYLAFNIDNGDGTCNYSNGDRVVGAATFEVDLRGVSSARLTFDHKWETRSTVLVRMDVMRIQISHDGQTWVTLDEWNSFDNNEPNWRAESYDLNFYAGNLMQMRFWFDSVDPLGSDLEGWFIDDVIVVFGDRSDDREVPFVNLDDYDGDSRVFDPARESIFHQMIWVHEAQQFDSTLGIHVAICGGAEPGPGDFSVFSDGLCGDTENRRQTFTLQEFGHNDFWTIEPEDDWCGTDEIHDTWDHYAMAGPCDVPPINEDYHENRWDEYRLDPDPFTPNPDEPNPDDSEGDLNNGVR